MKTGMKRTGSLQIPREEVNVKGKSTKLFLLKDEVWQNSQIIAVRRPLAVPAGILLP